LLRTDAHGAPWTRTPAHYTMMVLEDAIMPECPCRDRILVAGHFGRPEKHPVQKLGLCNWPVARQAEGHIGLKQTAQSVWQRLPAAPVPLDPEQENEPCAI
jgi:hypothetical protein